MDIKFRIYTQNDAPLISGWWELIHRTEYPLDAISSIGLIVEMDGIPSSCGFLYETNSKICFSDFVIVNPALPKKHRDLAINALTDGLVLLSKERGFKYIFANVRINKLIKRLLCRGFTDLGTTHYMARCLNG